MASSNWSLILASGGSDPKIFYVNYPSEEDAKKSFEELSKELQNQQEKETM